MIRYFPREINKRIASQRLIERLITNDLTINQSVRKQLIAQGIFSTKQLDEVSLKVLKVYKTKFKMLRADGAGVKAATQAALNQRKLLVERVGNLINYEVSESIKKKYKGERFRWLPSDAETPDPEHQLNYGKIFRVGSTNYKGREINTDGCQCGMEILTDDTELEI